MNSPIGPLSLAGLVLLGVAVLWAMRLAYGARRSRSDDVLRLVLNISAWVLIIVGLIGGTIQLLLILAPIGCVVVLGILMMVVAQYRSLERRTLLWMLSIAARKGIPLDEAAMAFAMERPDEMGLRAERLAELLRSGVPLPDALQQSRTRLPTDVLLAVRLGTETADLGASMQMIANLNDDLDSMIRSMFEKYFYLAILVVTVNGMMTFMMQQIVPVYATIFQEFALELPIPTQFLIDWSDWLVQLWFLGIPLMVVLPIGFLIGALYYIDQLPRDLPLLNKLARRIDSAHLMRTLALAVEQNWPLSKTVETLSRVYPKASVRRRLQVAGVRINQGESWCDSLREATLIRQSDAAVFKAAQRAGNLGWALREMADSSIRRLAYQLRFWLNVLFPLALLSTGVLIALVVVGLFMPLAELIQRLV